MYQGGNDMASSNIALIITDLEVGGAERGLVELATRLDCDQFRPVVYCLAPRAAARTRLLGEILGDGGNRRPLP